MMVAILCSCASPGHPSPPSLQVPRTATDLTVLRAGNNVDLHWTTPSRTTDGIDLKPPISAEICRTTAPVPARNSHCTVVQTLRVQSGPSHTTDTLPSALTSGSATLLAYQVQLRGSLGKTAGPSPAAFTVSGPAPAPVSNIRTTDTKSGALLQWSPQPAPGETVELTRTVLSESPAASPARTPTGPRIAAPSHTPSAPAITRLTAGSADSGGTLDRTAALGASYQYTAQRVRSLTLSAHTFELRSTPSAPVSVTMQDIFPPAAPTGLLTTPGPGSIDLSWDPGTEPRLAGYRVYRADSPSASTHAWTRLTPELLPTPSYRDTSAATGHSYTYRVTAVDTSGNESQPSPTATETAP